MKKLSTSGYAAEKHYFGTHAEEYDERRSRKSKWNSENQILQNYVLNLPRGSRVLDVPFGTGRFAPAYVASGLNVAGVDISRDMITMAKLRYDSLIKGLDLRVARAEDMPFADQSFDYLICNRFIKWLPSLANVEQVAAEFRRVCRKEMLIQVKMAGIDMSIVTSRLRLAIKRLLGRKDPKRSTARYTMAEYERAFARDGWKISETTDAPGVGPGIRYVVLRKS